MAFGRRGPREGGGAGEEAPVPVVEWARVREFTLGTVERPITKKRTLPVRGPRAIRVPEGGGESKVFAPCAYVARVAPPAPDAAMEPCLYEDPESQRLLCYLMAEDIGDGERRYRVHDADDAVIGVVRRVPPPSKLFKHTWRMEQPGRPQIVGRNEWVSGGVKRIADRAADKALTEALSSLPYVLPGGESVTHGGGSQRRSRKLEWWSGDELVMVSQSIKAIAVKADWLDRRLAFAFAVIGDS